MITDGGRGIGRGLSRLLLAKGHCAFILDNHIDELSNTTQLFSREFSSAFSSRLCNIRVPDDIKSAVETAHEFFSGHLDVLINNA